MPPRKSRNVKRPRKQTKLQKIAAQRRVYYSHKRWIQTKTYGYDDEFYEQMLPTQNCLYCYNSYMYDFNQRFSIRNRFCIPCRETIPFKQWCLINKFFRLLEETLNQQNAPPVENGAVLQFANGIFQSMRYKKSREYLVDTMNSTIQLSNLGTPMELAELFEQYDELVHPTPKSKRRETHRKKRSLRRRKNFV